MAPMDHSVKFWNNYWPFQAYFSKVLFDRFPSKLSLTTKHLLENVALKWYKTVQWALCLVFLDDFVTLGCKEHHSPCTHGVYFSQNMGLIPGRYRFCETF